MHGLGVLVASIAVFALGWFWYSNAGFFPAWQRLSKITDEQIKNADIGVPFRGTALFNALGVILLATLMAGLHVTGVGGGAALGAILGLVLRGDAHAIHNGFAIPDPRITLVDAASDRVSLALAGAILALFQ